MWLRRRHDEPTPGPPPDAARPVSGDAAPRRDWAQVPTLQRIGTGIDGVINTGFEADLNSWHSPGILRPLDHALSADGPSGTVLHALARSALPPREVPAGSSGGAPVQRIVTFEPPRRPTIAFTPDVPRSIEAVSFSGDDAAPQA